MKKLLFIWVTCLLMAVTVSAFADFETMTVGNYFIEADTENNTAVILSYVGTSEDLFIPEKVGGYRVTEISNLGYDVQPRTITIAEGVETLGAQAIPLGKQLTQIVIPDSLVTLEGNPFKDCSVLTDICISENHPALELIDGALYSKTEKRLICCLRTLNTIDFIIAPGTVAINDHAFYLCKTLTSVSIPDSVVSIGANAFYHCSSLKALDLPHSVRSIGTCAFMYCEAMSFAQIPDRMDHIGAGAFDYCRSLTNIQIYENDKAPEYDPAVIPEMGSTYTERYCEENGLKYIYLLANRY